MEQEIWKEIPIAPGFYASTLGRIKNSDGIILNGSDNGSGYIQVSLKRYKVHKRARLVAMTFIDNPMNKPIVDHINTVRTDDRVSNLRWVTNKENLNNPITRERIRQIGKLNFTGEKNPMYNRHHTQESREKMSNSRKGKHRIYDNEECTKWHMG